MKKRYTKKMEKLIRSCLSVTYSKEWNEACKAIMDKYGTKFPRCHEEAEAVAQLVGGTRVDGFFYGHQHSWVDLGDGVIFDSALDHLGGLFPRQVSFHASTLWHCYQSSKLSRVEKPRKKLVKKLVRAGHEAIS